MSRWPKRTPKHGKRHFCPLPSRRLLSLSPPYSLAISFLPPEQGPGPGPSPSSEDERQLDLGAQLSAPFWIYFAVEGKRGPGAERGAQLKPRSSLSRLSSHLIVLPPSLHLSIPPLLSVSPFVSMSSGPCDFAKMHHQQRMAALGTDKELSDLLDFSAVRTFCTFAHLLPLLLAVVLVS